MAEDSSPMNYFLGDTEESLASHEAGAEPDSPRRAQQKKLVHGKQRRDWISEKQIFPPFNKLCGGLNWIRG